VRITVSALRKRLGEPRIIATVAGVGYRIDTQPDTGPKEGIVDRASRPQDARPLAHTGSPHVGCSTCPRGPWRLRLTLLYSGLFRVLGVALLADYVPTLRSNTGDRPDRPDRDSA